MALFMNATATWNGGAINEVRSVELGVYGERITRSSDFDDWLTWQGVTGRDVVATVNFNDANQAAAFDDDVGAAAKALSVVARSADGGSDATISGSAMICSATSAVAHASMDNACSVSFGMVSSDGSSSPLTIS